MSYDDLEKVEAIQVEETTTNDSNDELIHVFSEAEQKSIIRRIDLRLIPPLGTLYCFSLMDMTNLESAVTAGSAHFLSIWSIFTDGFRLHLDLDLIGARFNIVTLIFFIPYVLCEPVATVLARKFGPRRFLSAIALFWGATMIVSIVTDKARLR
jgi:hypothetical protein